MKKLVFAFGLALCSAAVAPAQDGARWEKQAANVTITRDDWGIAHVHGKTDADAVFGMIYAQAEDDFNRVETNFINAMGRLSEAEGQAQIWRDLRIKLFVNPDTLKVKYAATPAWLKTLMVSWADGLNYYLYKHPEVKPRVITKFEPWMALSFTDGSIGPDYERINVRTLEAFYSKPATLPMEDRLTDPVLNVERAIPPMDPTGSNGIAISPNNTVNHRAILLINPHTSFFFRSELQMTSDEGLNAYGAATWGQFFIYQGFNDKAGWMHTSTGADFYDEFNETVKQKDGKFLYKHDGIESPLLVQTIAVPFKTDAGMDKKTFTVYRTKNGPVVREQDGKWVSVRIMYDPINAIEQSYGRIKTHNYEEFKKTMDLHTNSSNNTIFADASGNVAYFHANWIPKRDTKLDWSKPVDASDPATDWKGLLSVDETPKVLNPASGWIYNSNNWPWTVSGPSSPKREDFPVYVENGTREAPRGVHAIKVLSGRKDLTPQRLQDEVAFDSWQPSFAELIPQVVASWDSLPAGDALKAKTAEQIAMLRKWDYRWGTKSVETSLAMYLNEAGGGGRGGRGRAGGAAPSLVERLASASDKLTADFGSWRTPWGDINRFQRINDDIDQQFNDAGPSIPVMFTTGTVGSLASFATRGPPATKKRYGVSGNSFVAIVEFGADSVRARAVSAGGESGDPKSKHFSDQAERYATGQLRPVYFYPNQLVGHTERVYHPGQ